MNRILFNENGNLAVEYAFILPILLVTLFGIIELSMYLTNRQTLTYACNEGARVGILQRIPRNATAEDNAITTKINTILNKRLTKNAHAFGGIIINRNNDQNRDGTLGSSGDLLTVSLIYNHTFLVLSNLSFIIPGWDGTIPIRAVATKRIE